MVGETVEVQGGCSGGVVGAPKSLLKFDENYLKRINRWLKISEIWFFDDMDGIKTLKK